MPEWKQRYSGTSTPEDAITEILASWRDGDADALQRLLPLVRTELHRLARRHLGRERKDNQVQCSSLVQEAFLRLLPGAHAGWRNRVHFFAVASQVMRHVLVDYARERRCAKRGGAALQIPLDDVLILSRDRLDRIIAVDLALERLSKADERKSRVFEMRFFGGLTVEETAEVLGVAPHTVIRDWQFARAWLRGHLSDAESTQL